MHSLHVVNEKAGGRGRRRMVDVFSVRKERVLASVPGVGCCCVYGRYVVREQ